MKQKVAVLLALVLTVGFTACGNTAGSDQTEPASVQTETSQPEESTGQKTIDSAESGSGTGAGKILIAYFAVAENSEVDAVSSASVTEVNGEAKGLVRTVAEDIQAVTGGDLFSIETSVDYPGNIDELIEYASKEQEDDIRPELTSHIENLDEYDTVFIGYPNMEQGFESVLCA